MEITLLGDVHCGTGNEGEVRLKSYLDIVSKSEYSIQLGDLCGWPYQFLKDINPNNHRVLPGNHENYTVIKTGLYPHFLNDYGTLYDDKIFYVRGGFSLNYKFLDAGISWWPEEEISLNDHERCLNLYKKIKPEIVISHECPLEIARKIGHPDMLRRFGFNPISFTTKTQNLLQKCLECHQPKNWYFGHYHQSFKYDSFGTDFQCLNIMETQIIDI